MSQASVQNKLVVITGSTVKTDLGFSIIEAMLAAVILAVVTSGTLALYASYTRSLQINRRENQIQSALAADVATVLRTNRRVICTTGSCAISATDPGENDYFPDPANATAVSYFNNLCNNPSNTVSQTLVDQVIPLIDQQPQPTAFEELGITRNPAVAEQYPSSPLRSGHRYVVTWSRSVGGQSSPIRQITLTPTVANWCP